MKIARCRYRVPDLTDLVRFYCDDLGMRRFASDSGLLVGYDTRQCLLEFQIHDGAPRRATANSLYWKIGITFRNLDLAVSQLRARGLSISDPRQFLDVGYLCHLQDPNGLPIELLQQGFEGNHASVASSGAHPIAAQATLAHVTLRATDIAAVSVLCEQQLNMRLMSRQRVSLPARRFDLYFYA